LSLLLIASKKLEDRMFQQIMLKQKLLEVVFFYKKKIPETYALSALSHVRHFFADAVKKLLSNLTFSRKKGHVTQKDVKSRTRIKF